MVLNGRIKLIGLQSQSKYTSEIEKVMGASSTIMMEANMTTDIRMTASVTLTNLSTTSLPNARLYAVVYEDLGTNHNHYLVRDITPVETFTLAGRATATFKLSSDVVGASNKHLVVLLTSTSGEILQSLLVVS